jgi:hypothetical protein
MEGELGWQAPGLAAPERRTKMNRLSRYVIAGSLALSPAVAARAQLTNFTTIDYPDNPMNIT